MSELVLEGDNSTRVILPECYYPDYQDASDWGAPAQHSVSSSFGPGYDVVNIDPLPGSKARKLSMGLYGQWDHFRFAHSSSQGRRKYFGAGANDVTLKRIFEVVEEHCGCPVHPVTKRTLHKELRRLVIRQNKRG